MSPSKIISQNRNLFICWISLSVFLTLIFVNRYGFSLFVGIVTEEIFVAKPSNPLEIQAVDIFKSYHMQMNRDPSFELSPDSQDFAFFANNIEFFLNKATSRDAETFYYRLPSSRMLHADVMIFVIRPEDRKLLKIMGQMVFL